MNDLIIGFIGAALAALAGLIVLGLRTWIRRRIKLTGPHTEALDAHSKQIAQLASLVYMLVAVQKPQLIALMGILEALKKDMDGGFVRAHEAMKQALDAFDGTLFKIVRGECEEKKA